MPETVSPTAPALEWLDAALAGLWGRLRAQVLEGLVLGGDDAERRDADLRAARAHAREADDEAARVARAARAAGAPVPLDRLAELHALDDFDRQVLLLAAAPELDLAFGELLSQLRDRPLRRGVDIDLVLATLCETTAERLARRRHLRPDAPLLRAGLLALGPPPGSADASPLAGPLSVPPHVLRQLTAEEPPGTPPPLPTPLRAPQATLDDVVLAPAVRAQLDAIAHTHGQAAPSAPWQGRAATADGRLVAVLLHGPSGVGKTLTAEALAARLGRPVLAADDDALHADGRDAATGLAHLARLAERHRAVLVIDDCERLFLTRQAGNPALPTLLAALERFDGLAVLTSSLPDVLDEALDRHVVYKLELELPGPSLRRALWQKLVPADAPLADDVDFDHLAQKFEFSGGFVRNAVVVATGRAGARPPEERAVTMRDLLEGARTQLRHRLTRYAERTLTHLRLADLILPEDVKRQVTEVIEAVRARSRVFYDWGFSDKLTTGRGLSCLLDGEPGTGKTLCAEILAAELGLTLYRINVANVVDKYIGETEKNLTRIFKEASTSHALLLFDEADSLFAKRVDVRSSHDRFSNMEINVLLQLIERYEGLVVLTTNLKTGIDKAFERRLSFKIHFPFPDEELRERIWHHLVPADAPVSDDVDFGLVAHAFELSGGSIRNSLVRAAYRAAAEGRPIGLSHLQEAAKRECAATGKLYRVIDPDDY